MIYAQFSFLKYHREYLPLSQFQREVTLMSTLDHCRLIRLEGIVQNPFCLVLEYMNLDTLYSFLQKENTR